MAGRVTSHKGAGNARARHLDERLPVANCSIETFGPHTVLCVERFDRAWTPDGWLARLPQEDLCQSLGG
ncbi:HipA domain-containing protein, partial [Comamonas jiangduensis]|uniref:HipA domain-containing protein n=1 Tax=Comamonas jiangduensis TaxID=1194168 RepID=UPI003BF79600